MWTICWMFPKIKQVIKNIQECDAISKKWSQIDTWKKGNRLFFKIHCPVRFQGNYISVTSRRIWPISWLAREKSRLPRSVESEMDPLLEEHRQGGLYQNSYSSSTTNYPARWYSEMNSTTRKVR
jgi:hypothetical protein